MKKSSLLILLLLSSTNVLSDTHGKSLGSHVHGAIKIEMAVEGKSIDLSIDGPAESFVGFEYAPKTAQEKKVWSAAENIWTKELLTKIFIFDNSLGCKTVSATFKQEVDKEEKSHNKKEAGVHSDIEAEAKIVCSQNLAGQNLVVALKKIFPKIKKLAAEVVSTETKTIEIKSDVQTIKL